MPGRQFRIVLRESDLAVKWKGKLVAKSTTNKLLHAVSSIRSPPPISISCSLSPRILSASGSPPRFRVETTNLGPKTITVKNSGEQPYITTHNVSPRDPRILSPTSFPYLKSFVLTSNTTGITFLNIPDCPCADSQGLSKANFTTLEPRVPVVLEEEFWYRNGLGRS